MIAYWSFDDCSASDNTGHGFDGTFIGNPQCVTGNSGKALQFDGIKDYIDIGNKKLFKSGDSITIVAWIKPQNIKSIYVSPIISKWSFETDRAEWLMSVDYSYTTYMEGASLACGNLCQETSSAKSIAQGEWSFIGIQLSGNTVSYIKNGKVVDTDSNTYSFTDTDVRVKIASASEDKFFSKELSMICAFIIVHYLKLK